jgi:hypothetical protein
MNTVTGIMASSKRPSRFDLFGRGTWTRSNGSVVARIYERLTKASRRRDGGGGWVTTSEEDWYRKGLYDALKALQEELS